MAAADKEPESLLSILGQLAFKTGLSIAFGFFALHHDSDPEDCLAGDTSQLPISATNGEDTPDSEAVNVGQRFRFIFQILFIVHLFGLATHILERFGTLVAAPSKFFKPVFGLAYILTNICLVYSRFSHAGKVCAGDFIDKTTTESAAQSSKELYLVESGRFVKIYCYVIPVLTIGLCAKIILDLRRKFEQRLEDKVWNRKQK